MDSVQSTDSDAMSSPTVSVDDQHSEMSTSSTGGTPGVEGVEGDSGCSPDMDDSLACERVAAMQDGDMAVVVQVSRPTVLT